ncbi:MAG: ribonuclease P protein component [Anaerolineae bacterium]|nr:ribonuclease P protein component [Anaerolineae bacterium]
MKRSFRLTRSLDYKRVRLTGKSFAHPLLVLIVAPAPDQQEVKLGITAGRSVGNAVSRNRAKRRLRACADKYLCRIQAGWDIIVIARLPLVNAPFETIQTVFEQLLHKSKVLKEESTESARIS